MPQKFKQTPKKVEPKPVPRFNTTNSEPSKTQHIVWWIIFVQSLIAMFGSLYFSTFGDPVKNIQNMQFFPVGQGLEPCLLCWYARILMYPMVFISAIGIFKKDTKFTDYILPMAILGIFLEIYHYSLQMIKFANPFKCTLNNPCEALQVSYFGFITIPFLAFFSFALIFGLCLYNMQLNKKASSSK